MSKVAIVGAGVVGTTIAYTVMMRGVAREIVLVDKQTDKARAEAMDLNHGAMFVPPIAIAEGTIAECAGADVVVITAGAKQKPGQSRLDLVSANIALFRTLIPEVVKAAPAAHLLVVSNPVDVLTDVALRLSGLPFERVIGSGTVLDTSRFRFLLGRHFDVSVSNVHAYIIGEHGDSEVPLWSSVQIGAVRLEELASAWQTACRCGGEAGDIRRGSGSGRCRDPRQRGDQLGGRSSGHPSARGPASGRACGAHGNPAPSGVSRRERRLPVHPVACDGARRRVVPPGTP